MAPAVTDNLKAAVITAILAIGVSGLIVSVLALMLALFKTGLGTALFSTNSCCSNSEWASWRGWGLHGRLFVCVCILRRESCTHCMHALLHVLLRRVGCDHMLCCCIMGHPLTSQGSCALQQCVCV